MVPFMAQLGISNKLKEVDLHKASSPDNDWDDLDLIKIPKHHMLNIYKYAYHNEKLTGTLVQMSTAPH